MKAGWIWAIIGVVGIASAWLCRPIWQAWQAQRAGRAAVISLQEGDWARARLGARRALLLNPQSRDACWVLAELAEATGSPGAVAWRERVLALDPRSLSNYLALARAALACGRGELARATLAGAPNERRTNAVYHELAAQVAFVCHDAAGAESCLMESLRLAATNGVAQINLQIARLHASDMNVVGRAHGELLARKDEPVFGAPILRALAAASFCRGDLSGALALSTELQARPEASFEDRLGHLVVVRQNDGLCSQTLAEALTFAQREAGCNPDRISGLTRWMNGHGLASEALEWLADLDAGVRRSPMVRLAEAECYLASEQWPRLGRWLEASQWGDGEHVRYALLARAYREQKEEALAAVQWQRALRAAHGGGDGATREDAVRSSELARLSARWGWEKEAGVLLWSMAGAAGPGGDWARGLLARVCRASGDTAGLRRVYEAAVGARPGDMVARNNLAATSLLLGTNMASAFRWAREVYRAAPTNGAFACTYAYALHLQGRTREGLEILRRFAEGAGCDPTLAAYYGRLLEASGAGARAEVYLERARAEAGRLLPEEQELLRKPAL